MNGNKYNQVWQRAADPRRQSGRVPREQEGEKEWVVEGVVSGIDYTHTSRLPTFDPFNKFNRARQNHGVDQVVLEHRYYL